MDSGRGMVAPVMSSYRFYFLNAADQVQGARNFDVDGDVQALSHAHETLSEFAFTSAIEIWQTKRFVARVARKDE